MPADLPANHGQGAPAQQQQPADDDAAAGHAPVDQDFPADHGFIFHAYDDFDDDSDDEADGFDVPEDAPLGNWSFAEDYRLAELHYEHGPKWRRFSESLEIPGRSYMDIKTRWYAVLRSGDAGRGCFLWQYFDALEFGPPGVHALDFAVAALPPEQQFRLLLGGGAQAA
uniref:Uncharacterized protein n=1 Tax=Tetradesmus obliquus TaxID=3088 RepID=A0A383W3T3_TETOB|eukprot:jgi/Sobl393_1/16469/SZX71782.1